MHLNTTGIVVLLVLCLVAVASKITSTIAVSRHRELPRSLRALLTVRAVLFVLIIVAGLDDYFLPSAWQYPAVGFKLFLTLIGIWIALLATFPILLWRHRNAGIRKQIGVKIP